jgi:hypothetical protein
MPSVSYNLIDEPLLFGLLAEVIVHEHIMMRESLIVIWYMQLNQACMNVGIIYLATRAAGSSNWTVEAQ